MSDGQLDLVKTPEFVENFGIDIFDGIQGMGRVSARFAPLDETGAKLIRITDNYGTDFYASRVCYMRKTRMMGGRAIALINPGGRTKFAYWPKGAQTKQIIIHKGQGHLIVGDPEDIDETGYFSTRYYMIDAETTPFVTLQPGMFYTIEAASWSELVVSAVSKPNATGDWGAAEIPFEPGKETIKSPDGMIPVPEEFMTANFN